MQAFDTHEPVLQCRKDLDSLLFHYDPHVVFVSPRVAARHKATGVGSPDGVIKGTTSLRSYFQEALDKVPGLHLTLQKVLAGVEGCYAVTYTRETGAQVVECMKLDIDTYKIVEVQVFYDTVC